MKTRRAFRRLRPFMFGLLVAGASGCVASEKSRYMRHLSAEIPQRHAGVAPAFEPIALGAHAEVHVDGSD